MRLEVLSGVLHVEFLADFDMIFGQKHFLKHFCNTNFGLRNRLKAKIIIYKFWRKMSKKLQITEKLNIFKNLIIYIFAM